MQATERLHTALPHELCGSAQVKGELNMACCWRVTPLDSVAIRARTLAAEVAQKEDLLAVLAERTLNCSAPGSLRAASSTGNLNSLTGRKGLLQVKVSHWFIWIQADALASCRRSDDKHHMICTRSFLLICTMHCEMIYPVK